MQDSILELLWEQKQPKYKGGRCVAARRNGRLFVHPCSEALPFACKIKASSVMYYPDCDTYDARMCFKYNLNVGVLYFKQR